MRLRYHGHRLLHDGRLDLDECRNLVAVILLDVHRRLLADGVCIGGCDADGRV